MPHGGRASRWQNRESTAEVEDNGSGRQQQHRSRAGHFFLSIWAIDRKQSKATSLHNWCAMFLGEEALIALITRAQRAVLRARVGLGICFDVLTKEKLAEPDLRKSTCVHDDCTNSRYNTKWDLEKFVECSGQGSPRNFSSQRFLFDALRAIAPWSRGRDSFYYT